MRIALVTPWFGRTLIGGAERHAWQLAHALARNGSEVDVLTTCCRSFEDDWSTNYYRSGVQPLAERLRLHRFRVDSRDRVAFNRANAWLLSLPRIGLHGDRVPDEEQHARTFVRESINSRSLVAHLRAVGERYDAVLFMPYLYGTTLNGIPAVPERAFLIPCLHDEAYAYLDPVRESIAAVRGILFNSSGEEETAAALYGPGIWAKGRVVSEAIEPISAPRRLLRIGGFTPNRARYVLYLGKQVGVKNVDFMVAAYKLFRERRIATSLQLVLAGPTNESRSGDGVVDLGPVSEEVKGALLTYARALAQPSLHESFSRAVYESWSVRRPVFVHGHCRATARAVDECGGGWIGSTIEDWARMFAELDESSDDAVDAVGARGWIAAHENGDWDAVAARVVHALAARLPNDRPAIDQAVPLGDRAAAAFAAELAGALREVGCDTNTVVAESAGRRPGALVVAHVGSAWAVESADAYVVHDGRSRFEPAGRAVFATTNAIAVQLEERALPSRVLPLPVSPAVWNGVRPVHERWRDGRPVVLSIGRLNAADAQRLLDTFVAYLGLVGDAWLLVFDADCEPAARAVFVHERAELDLEHEVVLVGEDLPERYAAYRAATLALGIGSALTVERAVTALWFDVPIVAHADPVAEETVAPCGLVVGPSDARRLAALLQIVSSDEQLRAVMRAEGWRVRARHLAGAVVGALLEHVGRDRDQVNAFSA